jgi:hypothetical protein
LRNQKEKISESVNEGIYFLENAGFIFESWKIELTIFKLSNSILLSSAMLIIRLSRTLYSK